MIDENGEVLDLDQIDAVGRARNGGYDVWLCDGTRTITRERDAFDTWLRHVRSKSGHPRAVSADPAGRQHFIEETFMKPGIKREQELTVMDVLHHLTVKHGSVNDYLVTNTRKEYDVLLEAARRGAAPEEVYMTHRGIWSDRKRIIPPDNVLFN